MSCCAHKVTEGFCLDCLRVEVERLRAALAEAQDDLHSEFCSMRDGKHHPVCEQARAALSGAAQPRGEPAYCGRQIVWSNGTGGGMSICVKPSGHDEPCDRLLAPDAQPRGEQTWVPKDGKDWPGAYVAPDAQPRGEGARCGECGYDGSGRPLIDGHSCPRCGTAPPASGAPCREEEP
jgi:hypothetical protein